MSSEQDNRNLITDKEKIKSLLSERRNQLPGDQQRKIFVFDWVSHPVPKSEEDNMAARVVTRGNYSSLTEGESKAISRYIQSSSSTMTLEQAKSLRSALLQQKAMIRQFVLNSKKNEIARQYHNRGQGVLSLSKKFDCPPVNLFRAILSSRGYDKAEIKNCVQNPEGELNKRDRRELAFASEADVVSSPDKEHAHEKGRAFEAITSKFLKDLGVSFVGQNVLVEEQLELFGKTIASPDFLLLDAVTINGQSVHWIDAKAFYGANVKCRKSAVKRQASKYSEYWGTGAVLFLEGFSANLSIDGCIFVAARDVMAETYFQTLP